MSNHYSYPVPNSELITKLGLIKHPEGGDTPSKALNGVSSYWAGYFLETDRAKEQVLSPYAGV
jgi:predicted cupin superfamily sugar epimerase